MEVLVLAPRRGIEEAPLHLCEAGGQQELKTREMRGFEIDSRILVSLDVNRGLLQQNARMIGGLTPKKVSGKGAGN
jgi:hypothetical protein